MTSFDPKTGKTSQNIVPGGKFLALGQKLAKSATPVITRKLVKMTVRTEVQVTCSEWCRKLVTGTTLHPPGPLRLTCMT